MRLVITVFLIVAAGAVSAFGADDARRLQAQEAYARWQSSGTATVEEKGLMEELLFDERVSLPNGSLDDDGGPDAFCYNWIDNQNGDTVTFDWIELCGDPEAQFGPNGDDVSMQINWSFPFPFYGVNYTSAWISTNGLITFEAANSNWLNQCGSIDATQPLIKVHWDDLVASQTGDCEGGMPRIKYRDFGDRLVIEWSHVWHFPQSYLDWPFTFEAILYADGKIKMQYDTLDCGDYCNSVTVGIDVPGANGIEYICNGIPAENELGNGRAIWFGRWLSTPGELVIHPELNDIVLHWIPVACATGYDVYRSPSPAVDPIPDNLIGTTTDTLFSDVGVLAGPGTPYFYIVTANRP